MKPAGPQSTKLFTAQLLAFFKLNPDEWLYETDLAEKFGVDPLMVAGVLTKLRNDGFVKLNCGPNGWEVRRA